MQKTIASATTGILMASPHDDRHPFGLIAILGLVIGALIGLWESYRFFVVDKSFGTVDFHVPVVEIGLILIGSYLATLVTTYLPSRAASRVAPAEALRYE